MATRTGRRPNARCSSRPARPTSFRAAEAELQAANRTRGDRSRERVKTLVEQALADTSLIKSDVLDTIEEMIAQLDKKLSAQMNEIMHAPEFQQIESAWRGLKYLVFQSETDAMLKIRVMNVSKERALSASAAVSERRMGPEPAVQEGLRGGIRPARRSALWLPDRRLLLQPSADRRAAAARPQQDRRRRARAVLCRRRFHPDGDGFVERTDESARPQQAVRHARIRRVEIAARFRRRAICWPLHAARARSAALRRKDRAGRRICLRRGHRRHKGEKYAWMNAAYAMAANINRAFKEYGWCARIRGVQSGGEVEDLPTHTFPTDDGGVDLKCPTEIAISDRREAELAKSGSDPADPPQEHRPRRLSSARSRCSSRRPIKTIRKRRRRATCRRGCPICSPVAGSRTI